MSETQRDYQVGRGKPPVHSRFKKGQSGNPRGPRPKSLPALLVDALNEKVVATIDGELRDHQARRGRHSAGQRSDRRRSARHQDAAPFTAADEEVMATFITRLRQSWEEELRQRGPEQCSLASPPPQAPQARGARRRRPGQSFRGQRGGIGAVALARVRGGDGDPLQTRALFSVGH